MPKIGFFRQLFILLVSPILVLQATIPTLLWKVDTNVMNCVRKGFSGTKTGGWSYNLNLKGMKAYCKQNACTINDYTTSVLSTSLHEYFAKEEKRQIASGEEVAPVPSQIHVGIPFSLRQPIERLEDVKMKNDFGSLCVDLKIFKN